jgi:hypothetical protein
MSIAKYLAKLAQSITAQGVLGSAAVQGGGGGSTPTVSAVAYPGNDTAVNTAGGDTVTLTGTNFAVGVTVIVNGTQASVVTRVSATQLTFTAPAQATGSYIIYVVNTDGSTALAVPGLQYSPVPAWTTAAGTLGSPAKNTSFTTTLAATGDAITYSVFSGTLPSGITLNSSTGVLSGTTPDVATSTTYNFTVRSTDAQLQDTDRAFSITILPSNPTPTVEYLVVAGGGGGGFDRGGGGGAGGFRTATGYSVAAGSPITVTVGAGGTTVTASPWNGNAGGNSAFGSITSNGGGGGGGAAFIDGQAGGSGGGAGFNALSTNTYGGAGNSPSTSPSQGNSGGNGANGGDNLEVLEAGAELVVEAVRLVVAVVLLLQ